MRGRKPKPTRLKLVQGNPGKRPINGREPKPPGSLPSCPAHLSPVSGPAGPKRAQHGWARCPRQLQRGGSTAR